MTSSRRWSGSRLTRRDVLLLSGLAVLAPSSVAAQGATPTPGWVEVTPIPLAHSEFAAAVIGSQIYVAGGFGAGDRLDRFDTETGEWQQLADLPEAVHHPGVAALDGIVYLAGGYHISEHTEFGAVWAYDPATDAWEERAGLPTPRGALGLVALDGRLYAVGGARDHLGGAVTGAVEVYDPATDTWETRTEMLTPREHLAVVVEAGRIYAVGGRANGDEDDAFAAANEVYDPATDTWEALAPLPVPRGGLTGVAAAGYVVVLGGERGTVTFADADAFDPTTNTWTALPPMPTARHGLASAALGETVYAIAGSTRARAVENTTAVEALTLDAEREGTS